MPDMRESFKENLNKGVFFLSKANAIANAFLNL